jgi:hypothetical protein
VILASSQSVALAMQNNSTRSRADSAAAGSVIGIDDRFCTAGSYGREGHSDNVHRLLTLALNLTTAAAGRAHHRRPALPIDPTRAVTQA